MTITELCCEAVLDWLILLSMTVVGFWYSFTIFSACFGTHDGTGLTDVFGAALVTTGLNSVHVVTATQLITAGAGQHAVVTTGHGGHGAQHADVAALVHCAAVVAGHAVLVVVTGQVCAVTTPVVANARAIRTTSRETTTFFIGSSPFLHRRAFA